MPQNTSYPSPAQLAHQLRQPRFSRASAAAALAFALLAASQATPVPAQTAGIVLGEVRIGDGASITGLEGGDGFGTSVTPLGDIDGDGIGDLAVSAPGDDDGGLNRGAVYLVFLGPGGVVKSQAKISASVGGFTGALTNNDFFGSQVAALGDLDGDQISDLAVSAPFDDDGVVDGGAVWVLFLNADGSVKAHQKISSMNSGFNVALETRDLGSSGLLGLGDIDGDSVPDLAIGAAGDDDGGLNHGALYVLLLNTDGTVKAHTKISDTVGGFSGTIDDNDFFGSAIGRLDDIDGNGVPELLVGTKRDDDSGIDRGAAWILFINPNGTVITTTKISDTVGLFDGTLANFDEFGSCIAVLGDIDGDGLQDSAVGAGGDGATDTGAVWVLFQHSDGSVISEQKISVSEGAFAGTLGADSGFGATSCAATGDLNGDGRADLAVGTPGDDGATDDTGAVWLLFLDGIVVTTTTTTTLPPTTSTTLQPPSCGDATRDGITSASDALVALFAAVGALDCADCICDADGSGGVTASDALRLLQVAVGVPRTLNCPACL